MPDAEADILKGKNAKKRQHGQEAMLSFVIHAAGNPCRVIRMITEKDRKYYFKDRETDEDTPQLLDMPIGKTR